MKPMQNKVNKLFVIAIAIAALSGVFVTEAKVKTNHDTVQAVTAAIVPDDTDPLICGLDNVDCPDEVQKIEKEVSEIPVKPNTKINISKAVCAEKGFTNNCWKVLYAMHLKETTGNCKAKGDYRHGVARSRGCFQIQVKLHNVSVKCAEDYACSSRFTLQNLINHGYPTYAMYAIKRHNGDGPKAQAYARDVKYRISTLK